MEKIKSWETPIAELSHHTVHLTHLVFDSQLTVCAESPNQALRRGTRFTFHEVFGFRVTRSEDASATAFVARAPEGSTFEVTESSWCKTALKDISAPWVELHHYVVCSKEILVEVLCCSEPSVETF